MSTRAIMLKVFGFTLHVMTHPVTLDRHWEARDAEGRPLFTGTLPPVDLDTFRHLPLKRRLQAELIAHPPPHIDEGGVCICSLCRLTRPEGLAKLLMTEGFSTRTI